MHLLESEAFDAAIWWTNTGTCVFAVPNFQRRYNMSTA